MTEEYEYEEEPRHYHLMFQYINLMGDVHNLEFVKDEWASEIDMLLYDFGRFLLACGFSEELINEKINFEL